jgi:uncharacterized protein YaaR (DUF327 family)
MGWWCKERYNKDENNKLEGLHQKPDQMEETHWEGQNFSEIVAPQEEEEEEELIKQMEKNIYQAGGRKYVVFTHDEKLI